jgi:hypothetical protein
MHPKAEKLGAQVFQSVPKTPGFFSFSSAFPEISRKCPAKLLEQMWDKVCKADFVK